MQNLNVVVCPGCGSIAPTDNHGCNDCGYENNDDGRLLSIAEILDRPNYPAPGAMRLNDVCPEFIKAVIAAAQSGFLQTNQDMIKRIALEAYSSELDSVFHESAAQRSVNTCLRFLALIDAERSNPKFCHVSLAHELWAAAQLTPGEGITDGVDRTAAILARIDAERRVSAAAIVDFREQGWRDFVDSIRVLPDGTPLYRSPTPIPDGMRLVPIEPTE